jgi:hypothetical protein
MKHRLLLACLLCLSLPSHGLDGKSASAECAVQAGVEVNDGEFSLADLLPPDICPGFRHLAARLLLGRSPLPGSTRVFSGEEIRTLIKKSLSLGSETTNEPPRVRVPERITVRRSGARLSCTEILGSITQASSLETPAAISAGSLAPDADCGASGRIRQDAPIVVAKRLWNPAQGIWEITARCLQPQDCVPFLLRTRGNPLRADSPPGATVNKNSAGTKQSPLLGTSMVRPGQSMTLLWDQDGIQVILHVTCLDRGGLGETVRARLQHGDRVLRATVMNAETLRMQL